MSLPTTCIQLCPLVGLVLVHSVIAVMSIDIGPVIPVVVTVVCFGRLDIIDVNLENLA